jgi:DNA-binding NarL/FixJ family response regulator
MLPKNVAPHSETLTHRQRDVVYLLASGATMKQAGEILGIRARTIAFHKYRLMTRLHLQTNTDFIRFAIKEGIVTVDSDSGSSVGC